MTRVGGVLVVWTLLGSSLTRAQGFSGYAELKGYAWSHRANELFKMDLYTSLVADRPGAVHQNGVATDKGLKYLCEHIEAVREAIGWDAPLGADHFGNLSVNDSIRYARAFEPYQLAWAEDLIDYTDWRGYKAISDATTTPTLTGEDAFGLEEGFQNLSRTVQST